MGNQGFDPPPKSAQSAPKISRNSQQRGSGRNPARSNSPESAFSVVIPDLHRVGLRTAEYQSISEPGSAGTSTAY
jgi:hypothetical protein